MLTGKSPVIIFKFYEQDAVWKQGETDAVDKDGVPLVGQPISPKDWSNMSEYDKWKWHGEYIIPIYLLEEKIKMAVDEAEQNINVENSTIGNLNFETLVSNSVRMTLVGTSDNVVMIALLSAIAEVVKRISKQRYSITLYYDSVLVLNGRFTNISQSRIQNSNQKVLSLTISDLPYKDPTTQEEQKDKGGEINDTSGTASFPTGN